MPHKIEAFAGREELQRDRDELDDLVKVARARRPQKRFQLRKREFDRIEVGTVGRQKSDLRAGGFDGRADRWLFVDGEVVEHDDIAAPEGGGQHLLHVGQKAGVVDGPIEHGRRGEAGGPQRGNDRVRFPMTAGGVIGQAHAAATAPVAAQQVGRDAAFIEKDVVPGVAQRQPVAPPAPLSDDVGAALFVGVYRFF